MKNSYILFFIYLLGLSPVYSSENVSLQLNWKHQFEYAGFYTALHKGFYKEAGLNVEIKTFSDKLDCFDDLFQQRTTYCLTSSNLIVEKAINNKEISLLASYFKKNALVLVTQAHIHSIDALKKRTIMATENEVKKSSLSILLKSHNLSPDELTIVKPSFDIQPFIKGQVEAMTAFSSNEIHKLDEMGFEYNVFNFTDSEFHSFDLELFTSLKEAEKNPRRTKQFIEASRKGWEYAFAHKDEIIELIYNNYSKNKTKQQLKREADTIEALMEPNLYQIGAIIPQHIQENIDRYNQLFNSNIKINLDNYIFSSKKIIQFTPEEINFINKHPVITFSDAVWEPFILIDSKGKFSGIFKDYYDLIQERTGINFQFVQVGDGINFQLVLDALKNKTIDVIDGTGKTEDRKKYAYFSGPLMEVGLAIVSHKSNPFYTLESLKEKRIVAAKGSTSSEYILEVFPDKELIFVDSIDDALELLSQKKADAMLDNMIVLDYLIKNSPHQYSLEITGTADYAFKLYALIRNDYPQLKTIMDKAIASITREELLKINRKLIQTTIKPKKNLNLFSQEELDFIQNKKTIKLLNPYHLNPFTIVNDDNTISGFDKDLFNLISQISGLNFELTPLASNAIGNQLDTAQYDGISSHTLNINRDSYLLSNNILKIQSMLTSSLDSKQIATIKSINSLTLAIDQSNKHDLKILELFPGVTPHFTQSLDESIQSVVSGKADAIVDHGSVLYRAYELGVPYLTHSISLPYTADYQIALKKELSAAISIINKSLNYIGKQKLLEVQNKWFSQHPKTSRNRILNDNEIEYLTKQNLTACSHYDWLPYEKFDGKTHLGITNDILTVIQKEMDKPIPVIQTSSQRQSLQLINNQSCKMLTLYPNNLIDDKELVTTIPYLSVPIVIVTRTDIPSLVELGTLKKFKLGVIGKHPTRAIIEKKHSNFDFVEFETIEQGLEQLRSGKIDGFTETLISVGYTFQEGFYSDLKINGTFDEKFELSFAIPGENPTLIKIINKMISSFNQDKKREIINKWFYIKLEEGFDYSLIIKGLIPVFLILLYFFYRNYALKNKNKVLKEKVNDEIKKSHEKDVMIVRQNKLASMGEMVENISHQWKQPLFQINSAVLMLDGVISKKSIKDPLIEEKLLEIESLTEYMSKTIDDFSDFMQKKKTSINFVVQDSITKAIKIFNASLKVSQISLEFENIASTTIHGYPDELQQVLIILLNNAKDVLVERQIKHPLIKIIIEVEKQIKIKVCDNAGGVPEDQVQHIFDAYFTTKKHTGGSGLGLYIAKMIIEEGMQGSLDINQNVNQTCFEITLKNNSHE